MEDQQRNDRRIAVCGLGGIGSGMALRLADLGCQPIVWNRTESKIATAVDGGAVAASSPADAAALASFVLLCLSDEAAVHDVMFGPDGVVAGAAPGTVVIDFTTTSSRFATELVDEGGRHGVAVLDASVIGNPFHARTGDVRILVAGAGDLVERARSVLDALAKEVVVVGETGRASSMKLALNLLMGAQMASLAESVALAEAAGVAPDVALDVIASSGYASPMMVFRCALAREQRYRPPAFRLDLMAKDLRLTLAEADRFGAALPVTAEISALHHRAVGAGLGELDAVALLHLVRADAGLVDVGVLP